MMFLGMACDQSGGLDSATGGVRAQPAATVSAPGGSIKPVFLTTFGHSGSELDEEPAHLAEFEQVLLPQIVARQGTVIVFTVGLAGLGSPVVLARESFDTHGVDGDNPKKRDRLVQERGDRLMEMVRHGLSSTPFSEASDPFGGYLAAARFFTQFPPARPRTMVSFGDAMANIPDGCLLDTADLSPGNRRALLQTCSPLVPNLAGVRALLVGAGTTADNSIDTARSAAVEELLREFFAVTGATLTLYGPTLINGGLQ